MLKTFYLGYKKYNSQRLTEFKNAQHADYEAEEWAEIEAVNLKEAKSKYEESFLAWKEKAGLAV
jgi:hypothetical protein